MTTKDAIRNTLEMGNQVLMAYISDLSDDELFTRPGPGCNHVAWQLGHLIASENMMMSGIGAEMPPLPDGFAESHTPETAKSDDEAKFHKKDLYLGQMATQRAATLAALSSMSDADLDKPAPESMREYCATAGAAFNLVGMHMFMHAGQFVPVRRKLGKPVLI